MSSIAAVQSALQQDEALQQHKYNGAEPSVRTARFHVDLPHGPQHLKFSYRGAFVPDGAEFSDQDHEDDTDEHDCGITVNSFRFNIQTLRAWFKDIDVRATGSITQRELIIALRQHKGMQALFCTVQGIDYANADDVVAGTEAATIARRQEILRIKRILDDIDTDGSGTMEWEEFVEFFRRAGLFLEYKTRTSLNHCSAVGTPKREVVVKQGTMMQDNPRDGHRMTLTGPRTTGTMTAKDIASELFKLGYGTQLGIDENGEQLAECRDDSPHMQ